MEAVTSIGDEPPNGPDAYYLLRDIPTKYLITALTDKNIADVAFNSIITIRMHADLAQPLPTAVQEIRDHINSHAVGSTVFPTAANHIAFADVIHPACRDAKHQPDSYLLKDREKDLFDSVARVVYQLVDRRDIYDKIFAGCVHVRVPNPQQEATPPARPNPPDLRYYNFILNSCRTATSTQAVHGGPMVDVALCALLEQTVHALNDVPDEGDAGMVLRGYLNDAADPISFGTSQQAAAGTDQKSNSLSCLQLNYHDKIGQLAMGLLPLKIIRKTPMEIAKAFLNNSPTMRYLKSICVQTVDEGEQRKHDVWKRQVILHAEKRLYRVRPETISDSEFSGWCSQIERHAHLINTIEAFLADVRNDAVATAGTVDPKNVDTGNNEVNLISWRSLEHMNSECMAQTVQRGKLFRSELHSRYWPHTKATILLMLPVGPVKRGVCKKRTDLWAPTVISYGLFWSLTVKAEQKLQARRSARSPSRSAPATNREEYGHASPAADDLRSVICLSPYAYNLGADTIIKELDDCEVFYPWDDCQVRVYGIPRNKNDKPHALNTQIHGRDGILQWGVELAKEPKQFYLTFSLDEGTVLSFTQKDAAPPDVTLATESGLLVRFFTEDGRVVQSYPSAAAEGLEAYYGQRRTILKDGTVISRSQEDRTIKIAYADGNCTYVHADGSCVSCDSAGSRRATDSRKQAVTISPLSTVREELEDGTVVTTREDLTVTVKSTAGKATVTEHVDGTRISNIEAGPDAEPSVVIECGPEFAHVQQFAKSRESVVTLPTGTVVRQLAPVTVKLSGKQSGKEKKVVTSYSFLLTKPQGPSLFVRSDGCVRFVPSTITPPADINEIKGNSGPTGMVGVYCIDYKEGSMSVKDINGNHFTVANGKITASKEDMTAEQSMPVPNRHPLVNALIPPMAKSSCPMSCSPRLFLIFPDGSGRELLRDHDIEHYLSCHVDDPATEIVMSTMPRYTAASCLSIIKNAPAVVDKTPNRRFLRKAIVEDEHQVPRKDPSTTYNVYRSLVCYEPISTDVREAMEAALKDEEAWRTGLESASDKYILQDNRSKEAKEAVHEVQQRVAEALAAHKMMSPKLPSQVKRGQKSETLSLAGHNALETANSEKEDRLIKTVFETGTFSTTSKVLKAFGSCGSGSDAPTLPSGAPVIARPRTAEAARLCALARQQSRSSTHLRNQSTTSKEVRGGPETAEDSVVQQRPRSGSVRSRSARSRLVRTPQRSAEGGRSKSAAGDTAAAADQPDVDEDAINWDDIWEEIVPENPETWQSGGQQNSSSSVHVTPLKESGIIRPIGITVNVPCVQFKNVIDGTSNSQTLKITNVLPSERIAVRVRLLRPHTQDRRQDRYEFAASTEKLTLKPRETAGVTLSLLPVKTADDVTKVLPSAQVANRQLQNAKRRRMQADPTPIQVHHVLQLTTMLEVVNVDLWATIHPRGRENVENPAAQADILHSEEKTDKKSVIPADLPQVLAIRNRKQGRTFAR